MMLSPQQVAQKENKSQQQQEELVVGPKELVVELEFFSFDLDSAALDQQVIAQPLASHIDY